MLCLPTKPTPVTVVAPAWDSWTVKPFFGERSVTVIV